MTAQFMFEYVLCWSAVGLSHKHNSNSLAAVLRINKSKAADNSKRLYTPGLEQCESACHYHICEIAAMFQCSVKRCGNAVPTPLHP